MKALVGVKRVLDYSIKVRVNAQKTGVDTNKLKHSMNPFDEIAVEECLRLKASKQVSEVTAVSIGGKEALETLRVALAMGADNGIHITTDMKIDQELQPLAVAKVFKKLMEDKAFNMMFLGKQSIDGDYNQTGQILASMMDIPAATFCSEVKIDGDNVQITREVDFGLQTIDMSLPAVFTCDLRLNTPRFTKVTDILKAKKKKVEVIDLKEMGIDVEPRLTIEQVEAPKEREGGVIVGSVDELVDKLRNEAKVL
jgi:electron transfer flavoprotein beta subunit